MRTTMMWLALWPALVMGQRMTYTMDVDFPELTHANGGKTIGELRSLEENADRYRAAYLWWTQTMGQAPEEFNGWTVASACFNEAHWSGSGAGFGPGRMSTSRNNVDATRIYGEYLVNVGVTVLQGVFRGSGTSIGLNGNASLELRYDHERWMDPREVRAVIVSGNWGTSAYLESLVLDGVRIEGGAPGWKDESYTQHGVALRMLGETARVGRLYVSNCNGHGVWVHGAGPGVVEHLTTFDNNLAGLFVSGGNSLGMLQVHHVSGDNNAWVVLNDHGPAMKIGYLKSEDGLSAQRGKPKKWQVALEARGWVNILVLDVTDAVHGPSGPAFVVKSTANKSRLNVVQYAQVAAPGVGEGRTALVVDARAGRGWMTSQHEAAKFRVMDMLWTGHGTASTFTCSEAVSEFAFGGDGRLGVPGEGQNLNYQDGTPEWNPAGPVSCSWSCDEWQAWGEWSECSGGLQERFRERKCVEVPEGCGAGVRPDLEEMETRPCTTIVADGIDPQDVTVIVNRSTPGSREMAEAYCEAWGIPLSHVVEVEAGSADGASVIDANALRSAAESAGREFTVLAMDKPSRVGSQSITSYVTFGAQSVTALTPSPLYGYTGLKPRTERGVAPSWLLVSTEYIRRDAHRTDPGGRGYLVLANDQTGQPRGQARKDQRADVEVWDNLTNGVGRGSNACNYLSNNCWLRGRTPVGPVVAAYQSMYLLGEDGGITWRPGFYGDHVTSFGGFLDGSSPNSRGQTPLTYHLDRGASMSVGTVSEPWQGASSLPRQFVNVEVFHPLFVGGVPVGVAAWSAVEAPGRSLFAGDGMCAPFTRGAEGP